MVGREHQGTAELRSSRLGSVGAPEPDRAPANEVADHDPIGVPFPDRHLINADHLWGPRAGTAELLPHVLRLGGSTWEPTGLLAEPQTVVTALAVGPGDQVVVATTAADILRSKDAGRTWQALLQRGRPAASGR